MNSEKAIQDLNQRLCGAGNLVFLSLSRRVET